MQQQADHAGTRAGAVGGAHAGSTGKPAGPRAASHRTGQRLLRTRPDGRRAERAEPGGRGGARVRAGLQCLWARLRDARRGSESRAEFRARAAARAHRLGDPAELGLVSVLAQPRARLASGVRGRGAEPAVQESGDRAAQRGALCGVARRLPPRRAVLPPLAGCSARLRARELQPRAARVPRGPLRRGAGMDEERHADQQPTARRAAPRRVRRTQARRSPSRAFLRLAAQEPVPGGTGDQEPRDGEVRVMATEPRAGAAGHVSVGVAPGARLRAAREAAGMSLDQVAQQLKLAPRQVKALEEQDFAHLPGRTFTRGFMRNYARLLNLDPGGLLASLPDADEAPALDRPALQATGAMIAELPATRARGPGFARWLIPLLLVACVIAAAAYEWYGGGLGGPRETQPLATTKGESAVQGGTSPQATTTVALPNPLDSAAKSEPSAAPTPPPAASAATPAPAAVAAAPTETASTPGATPSPAPAAR